LKNSYANQENALGNDENSMRIQWNPVKKSVPPRLKLEALEG